MPPRRTRTAFPPVVRADAHLLNVVLQACNLGFSPDHGRLIYDRRIEQNQLVGGPRPERWILQIGHFPRKPTEMTVAVQKDDGSTAITLGFPSNDFQVEVFLYDEIYKVDGKLKDLRSGKKVSQWLGAKIEMESDTMHSSCKDMSFGLMSMPTRTRLAMP